MERRDQLFSLSVITVVLNCATTIEQTIQSILSQNCSDVEFILIDGGSTDGTVDIIRKYEEHISYWVSEPDDGIYSAMNKALDHAHGDVISFLNAGDYYYNQDVLSRALELFREDPETDILIGRELISGKVCKTYMDGNYQSIYYGVFFPHQATFSKSKLYRDYRKFNEKYKICADYDWVLGAYYYGYKINWCDEIFAVYDPDGISASPKSIYEQALISAEYLRLSSGMVLLASAGTYYSDVFCRSFFRDLMKKKEKSLHIKECINKASHGRKVDIWGVGNIGKQVLSFLIVNEIIVEHILDSDVSKQGLIVDDVPVSGLKEKEHNFIIISTADYEGEVACMLNDMGLNDPVDYMTYTNISIMITQYLIKRGYDDYGFFEMLKSYYE